MKVSKQPSSWEQLQLKKQHLLQQSKRTENEIIKRVSKVGDAVNMVSNIGSFIGKRAMTMQTAMTLGSLVVRFFLKRKKRS